MSGAGDALLEPLARAIVEPIVRAALEEDLGLGGDVTSEATIDSKKRALAAFVARESGVVAGLDVALCAFRLLDPHCEFDVGIGDGRLVESGSRIAAIVGDARAVLAAERTALNFLCRLSGIATLTAEYVAAAGSACCAIADTRKTTPGLRALEKYAVRAGGGRNHRFRLDDAILIKDNHVALGGGIERTLAAARERAGHLMKIEIEVDSLAQLDEVLACTPGADAVLLDNFNIEDLHAAVERIAGRLVVEASGGVNLENVADVAATGVDIISVGALTGGARSLDIGLDIT